MKTLSFTWPENKNAPSASSHREPIRVAAWPDGTTFFDTPHGRISEGDARAISGAYIELLQRRAEAEAAGKGN